MRIFLVTVCLLAGCTSGVKVREATPVTPLPASVRATAQNGAIFHEGVSYRPLFEDRRARYPGDTLTVTINERTQASRAADGSASRDASAKMGVAAFPGAPNRGLPNVALDAAATSKLESKESASASNLFSGSIAVTVVEVLANGNLVVVGEKRIGINNEIEKLRFSGVVNPQHVGPGNVVSSVNVSDARIEAASHSHFDSEQLAGFVERFFMGFFPFR